MFGLGVRGLDLVFFMVLVSIRVTMVCDFSVANYVGSGRSRKLNGSATTSVRHPFSLVLLNKWTQPLVRKVVAGIFFVKK